MPNASSIAQPAQRTVPSSFSMSKTPQLDVTLSLQHLPPSTSTLRSRYSVRRKELLGDGRQNDDVLQDMIAFLRERQGQAGVIYARLRRTVDWLTDKLWEAGLDAAAFHAGRDEAARHAVLRDWMAGDCPIVVATVAFGMGIDKADVRWVVHWEVPSSMEGFYQESGRCVRGGARMGRPG